MDATCSWFTETCQLWPNQKASFKVRKILHHEKSKYQDIVIFESESYGRMLALDGIIQCSEWDECSYQEMITFLPLNCHVNPKNVLIIGGGDGGVAREVVKHPAVELVHQVEIDERVIELSKIYLPFMAKGFSSTKLKLFVDDGFQFMKMHQKQYDVIITDSSDPIGPATSLFTAEYFKLLKQCLKPGGIICNQGGNPLMCPKLVRDLIRETKLYFTNVSYAISNVPTYPGGQIGYLLATETESVVWEKPTTIFTSEQMDKMQLKYYSKEIHYASLQLPKLVTSIIFS